MTEEHFVVEEHTESQVMVEEEVKKGEKEEEEQMLESEGWAFFKADGVEFQLNLKQRLENERKDKNAERDAAKTDNDDAERYFIGESSSHAKLIVGRQNYDNLTLCYCIYFILLLNL